MLGGHDASTSAHAVLSQAAGRLGATGTGTAPRQHQPGRHDWQYDCRTRCEAGAGTLGCGRRQAEPNRMDPLPPQAAALLDEAAPLGSVMAAQAAKERVGAWRQLVKHQPPGSLDGRRARHHRRARQHDEGHDGSHKRQGVAVTPHCHASRQVGHSRQSRYVFATGTPMSCSVLPLPATNVYSGVSVVSVSRLWAGNSTATAP